MSDLTNPKADAYRIKADRARIMADACRTMAADEEIVRITKRMERRQWSKPAKKPKALRGRP